ncbi:MAG TPA: protein kinase [Candidatus Binatia bacterium]|nr:protein kinase [Candidatus Binatia bacterium]
MALTSGTRLGPYEIVAALGAGGMGEVYKARDTRLDRSVAIKVLAAHLSSSPELRQRMEREARAISALNHPHICHLYDIGSQNGTDYLVMELLEGETLAEKLKKGPLPLAEIYKIGVAVAEALAAAHKSGIVHRDLKPGNIMLAAGGAKLMDFGLAKPWGMQTASSGSASAPPSFTAVATLSGPSPLTPLTTAGSIVGTIQYMSPEQIEGKEADARSDIFAFGTVLYEMVAGKRPFTGKSQISLASAILENDPEEVTSIKPQTPPAFNHVVKTCLQKNPDDRYLAAHDIKIELQFIAADKSASAPILEGAAAPRVSSKRERLGWTAGLILAIAIGALVGVFLRPGSGPAPGIRTVIDPPEKTRLNLVGDSAGPPVLSPDGSTLAFAATGADTKTMLWVRPMNLLEAHILAGTEGAIFPFWSPDGRSLGFFADGKVKTVDLNGGAAQVVAEAPFGRGGAWGADGVIVFSPLTQTSLVRVSASGGTPVPLTKIDASRHTSHRWPFFLPDGKHFLYLAINHDPSKGSDDAVYYASLDGRENREVLRCQSNVVYGGGYLLFARGDQLMGQPFDPASGKLSGEPQSVAKGVANDISTWHMDASTSINGLLVFASGGAGDWQLLWVDRNGKRQAGTVTNKLANLRTLRLSPQGDRVALEMDNGVDDIWVLDVARGIKTRLTFGPATNGYPVWSPDGKWIAYTSDRDGHSELFRKPSDGSGAEELLLKEEQVHVPADWSRDGKYLIYAKGLSPADATVWVLPLEGERKPWQVLQRGVDPHLSPDQRWLAYTSLESGAPEVYVVPFRGGQGKWQVSANGGQLPQWSSDGKELYYFDQSNSLAVVPVAEVGGALQFGAAQTIVTNWASPNILYDVTPDGKKILLDEVSQQVSQSVTVVTNFTAALKK